MVELISFIYWCWVDDSASTSYCYFISCLSIYFTTLSIINYKSLSIFCCPDCKECYIIICECDVVNSMTIFILSCFCILISAPSYEWVISFSKYICFKVSISVVLISYWVHSARSSISIICDSYLMILIFCIKIYITSVNFWKLWYILSFCICSSIVKVVSVPWFKYLTSCLWYRTYDSYYLIVSYIINYLSYIFPIIWIIDDVV